MVLKRVCAGLQRFEFEGNHVPTLPLTVGAPVVGGAVGNALLKFECQHCFVMLGYKKGFQFPDGIGSLFGGCFPDEKTTIFGRPSRLLPEGTPKQGLKKYQGRGGQLRNSQFEIVGASALAVLNENTPLAINETSSPNQPFSARNAIWKRQMRASTLSRCRWQLCRAVSPPSLIMLGTKIMSLSRSITRVDAAECLASYSSRHTSLYRVSATGVFIYG